jgi:hypothetical protein
VQHPHTPPYLPREERLKWYAEAPKVGCNFGGMFALGILILLFFDAEVENRRVVSIERVDRQYGQKVFLPGLLGAIRPLGYKLFGQLIQKLLL